MNRKQWGIASIITGTVFVVVGVIVIVTNSTPAWVPITLSIITGALNIVGLSLLATPQPPA